MNNKKLFRYAITPILGLSLFLLLGALIPRKWPKQRPQSCQFKICVSNLGFHADIIVPVKNEFFDWQNYLKLNQINKADYNYLGFGWGERDYYVNTPDQIDQQIYKGTKALFLPNPSVIRVEAYETIPQNNEIKCFGISQQGYLKLTEFIKDTFRVDNQGRKINLSVSNSGKVSYYEAKGTYSILNNCNSWTAEALRIADVNTPLWAWHSSVIMFHLDDSCQAN